MISENNIKELITIIEETDQTINHKKLYDKLVLIKKQIDLNEEMNKVISALKEIEEVKVEVKED